MRIPLIVTISRLIAVHEGLQKYNTFLLIIIFLGTILHAIVAANGKLAEVQWAKDARG